MEIILIKSHRSYFTKKRVLSCCLVTSSFKTNLQQICANILPIIYVTAYLIT